MFPNYTLDRLNKQREEIDNLIKNYREVQQPVNNFINTSQPISKDLIEWRILNENEEVDNLYVPNKTLFINDKMMVLKGVDGSLEKWEIKKVYPIDKKDEKINQLEEEIKQLKELIQNEYSKSSFSNDELVQSNANDNEFVEPKSKTTSKPISKQEQSRTSTSNR